MMLVRWFSTVFGLMHNRAAMCFSDWPSASSAKISCSRDVSVS